MSLGAIGHHVIIALLGEYGPLPSKNPQPNPGCGGEPGRGVGHRVGWSKDDAIRYFFQLTETKTGRNLLLQESPKLLAAVGTGLGIGLLFSNPILASGLIFVTN